MTNEELNTALYEKMFAEQEKYRAWLLSQPPEEILNHTYEYTMREDILYGIYVFRTDYAAVRFFFAGSPCGCGIVLSASSLCGNGNRILDVCAGGGSLCCAGLCVLPRHDGGTVSVGLVSLGNAGAEGN